MMKMIPATTDNEEAPEFEAQKMVAEERQSGNLRWAVVSAYFRNGGSLCFIMFTIFMIMLTAASSASADYWVSYW